MLLDPNHCISPNLNRSCDAHLQNGQLHPIHRYVSFIFSPLVLLLCCYGSIIKYVFINLLLLFLSRWCMKIGR